jgi:circadian clock protein KaiB
MKTTQRSSPARTPRRGSGFWHLRLYVAGQTPRSLAALANLRRLCELHLPNRHEIEVIDLTRHPERAKADQIVAIPTLVRRLPEPVKRLIGDLSNTERVFLGIELTPAT